MDYPELVDTLRTAMGFGRDLLSLKVDRDATAKIAGMNDAILNAQSYAIAAQVHEMDQAIRIRALEEEVERLQSWDAKKDDYELKSLGRTSFVYVVNKSSEICEPPFWMCPTCFENAKKSIMQKQIIDRGWDRWGCPVCKTQVRVTPGTHPS